MGCPAWAPRSAPSGALIFAGRDLEPRERPWPSPRRARGPSLGPRPPRRASVVVGTRCRPSSRSKCSRECFFEISLYRWRFLQMTNLKHKEAVTCARSHSWEEESVGFESLHPGTAKLNSCPKVYKPRPWSAYCVPGTMH